MRTYTIKLGKSPDEMTFDECMAHIKRVLFWDYIDGEWCDVVPLSDKRWEELAGYISGAHGREVDALKTENAKLRELADAVKEFVEDIHCEDCPCRRDCDDNNRIFCVNDFSYHAFAAMRELGIEESYERE